MDRKQQAPVRLITLGRVDFEGLDPQRAEKLLRGRKGTALLVYLAASSPGTFAQRDTLLPLLWPDKDQARGRHALRNALHGLRGVLGRDSIINRGKEEIALAEDALTLDTTLFETACAEGRFGDAASLYTGDFLDGFHVRGVSPQFEHWVDRQREGLAREYRSALEAVATEHADAGRHGEAARALQLLSDRDPLNGEYVTRLMTELAAAGNLVSALRVADDNSERRHGEYQLEPDDAVLELAERLRSQPTVRPTPPPDTTADAGVDATPLEPLAPEPTQEQSVEGSSGPAFDAPQARPSAARRVGLTALVAGAVAVALSFNSGIKSNTAPGTDAASLDDTRPAMGLEPVSLAVLPMTNQSADPDQDDLPNEVVRELRSLLSHAPEVRLVAPESSPLNGGELSPPEIAEKLDVRYTLTGFVNRRGDRIIVYASLMDPRSGAMLWDERFEREPVDADEIYAEIVKAVVTAFAAANPNFRIAPMPTSAEAYALYLKARNALRTDLEEGHVRAEPLLKRAIELSPDYTRAWLDLVDVHVKFAAEGEAARVQLARTALERALELDPESAVAHGWLGWLALSTDRDLAAAARHYERAMELDPTHPDLMRGLTTMARTFGLFGEATQVGRHYVEVDPTCLYCTMELARTYDWAGRLDEADERYEMALELSQRDDSRIWFDRGLLTLRMGEPEAALEMFSRTPPLLHAHGRALANLQLGRMEEAEAAVADLASFGIPPSVPYLAQTGEMERAFSWLEYRLEARRVARTVYFPDVVRTPLYERLHDDPRWLPLLEKYGLAPEQLDAIDFKLPVAGIIGKSTS